MPATVESSHCYPVKADRLWTVAADWDALAEADRGMVRQIGLPGGRFRKGQRLEIEVSAFGLLPPRPYVIEILDCDDAAFRMTSREEGTGIRSWTQRMRVEAKGERSRLHDRIAMDAGPAMPLFAAFARWMRRRRHAPRMRMLGLAA